MITNTQGAYFNDPAIKAKYVDRYKQHMAADAVIQGTGYAGGKGCFIGCTLENYSHVQFERELNVPQWAGHLTDKYFENCPSNLAAQFGLDVLEAIKCGQNIEPVRWKLAVWRHTKQLATLHDNNEPYAVKCKAALQQVIEYCQSKITGSPDDLAAADAHLAALSAASLAARFAELSDNAAVYLAARRAAEALHLAAFVYLVSAASVADIAQLLAASAQGSAARSAVWQEERDMFLQLIRGTKLKGSN